jgi:hypothetical protein
MIGMRPAVPEAGDELAGSTGLDDRIAFPRAAALIVVMSVLCWCAVAVGCSLLA